MIKTRLGAQRYNNRMDKVFREAMSARRWPVEFICNGETQVMGKLTEAQVHEITKMIESNQ